MEKRLCRLCGVEKTLLENFYRQRNKELFEKTCKDCRLIKMRERVRANYDPVKSRKYHLQRRERPGYKQLWKKWAAKFPEKYIARYKLRNAVYGGKIKKFPCEVCGDVKSEGHHDDYSKPFEVKWLCLKHHKQRHTELHDLARLSSTKGL